LFGAPPGYVGYDQGGQLTEAVRRKPYSVILLHEIEKAYSKVFETLLQVLDDGRMTDGQGHVVDFKNTIIIMTSNLGATFIAEHIGDDSFSETKPMLIQQIVQLLKQKVSSEFVNRIDEFLLFNPLTKDAIRKISILQLTRLIEKLSKNGINIIIDDDVINYIVESGFDPEMGARPIKRVIDKLIVDPLAENVLSSRISKDKQIIISYLNNGLVFHN
jgi:ATP-dependent Clp protease ATP-binding subunit ClpB